MLRRNLLYTGITRAKNFLILCGEPEEFRAGINRTDELERQTTLKERLNGDVVVPESEEAVEQQSEARPPEEDAQTPVYELTMATFIAIDPMIGMKGITPYDYLETSD